MAKNDYVQNEIYAKHLSRGERGYMPNYGRDRQGVYERFYYKRLSELATSRFKWVGLPETVDPRFLEVTLLNNALAIFFRDTRYATTGVGDAYFALRGSPSGGWNPTDNPTRFTVTGNNFPTTILKAKDCVPIWANYARMPDIDVVQIYAHRLATLDHTIDINAANARRTKVAFADENQRLTVTNIVRQLDEGQPVIYLNQPLGGAIEVADFGVDPKGIEALHILKVRLWNECMMLLGIHGANQDKKERLVASEVDANDEQIDLNRAVALNARTLACEQIERKYGISLSVEFVTQQASIAPIEGV